jgi:hypothetical protein
MLLRARKPFEIGGRVVSAGEVVDLSACDLPPGRAQTLVNARYGEYVVATDLDCDACARTFSSAHALSVHKGRAHRGTTEE